MGFFKRLVYWIGLVFILTATFFAAVLFIQTYPEVGEAVRLDNPPDFYIGGFYPPAWFYAVVMATGICALGSYLILALETRRLRRKIRASESKEAK